MPSSIVNKVVEILNIPKPKVEKMWKDSEKAAKESSTEFNYGLVTNIFKNKLTDSQLKKLGWVKSFREVNAISYVTISNKVNVKSGKASEALVILSGILNQLTSLTNGEEALLKGAPENIINMTNVLTEGMKKLVAEVNVMVGTKPQESELPQKSEDVINE